MKTNHSQSGFSLVELLIASAIGLFLMSAIVQVFSQSRATVSLNQSINEIQDRGRTVLHHLAVNLKQRGHQGCLPPIALNINEVDAIDWVNTVTVTPIAKALPALPFTRTALRGYEVNAAGNFSPVPNAADMQAIAAGAAGVTPRPLSDVVHVAYGDRQSVGLAMAMGDNRSLIELTGNDLNLAIGDLIMIGDCTAADIVAITGITVTGSRIAIEHGTSNNRVDTLTKPYDTNARVRRFRHYTYFVADTGRATRTNVPIFSLYRVDHNLNAIELVDGIDFLQLSYKQVSPLGILDLTADTTGFDPMKVVGIDLGLLVVGLKDVLQAPDTKIYRLPGAAVGPNNPSDYGTNKLLKTPFRSHIDIKNRS